MRAEQRRSWITYRAKHGAEWPRGAALLDTSRSDRAPGPGLRHVVAAAAVTSDPRFQVACGRSFRQCDELARRLLTRPRSPPQVNAVRPVLSFTDASFVLDHQDVRHGRDLTVGIDAARCTTCCKQASEDTELTLARVCDLKRATRVSDDDVGLGKDSLKPGTADSNRRIAALAREFTGRAQRGLEAEQG